MRVIIIEDTVYKVSEREFKQLQYMENKVGNAQYPDSWYLEIALSEYLTEKRDSYIKVGAVDFHFQL